MKKISAIICTIILNYVCVSSVFSAKCRSYGGQNGDCVDIARCPPLLAIILSNEKTAEHIRILQKLTCLAESRNSKDPVVCCPESEIVSASFLANPQDYFGSSPAPPTRRTTTPQAQATTDRGRLPPYIQRLTTTTTSSPRIKPPPSGQVVYPSRRKTSTTERTTQGGSGAGFHTISTDDQLQLRMKFMTLIPPLANCSLSSVTESKIIGGQDTDHGEYPWMARLGYKNKRSGQVEYYCGGVVINKRYILTAAHCTYGYDESFELVHVRLGEHNTKQLTDCSMELGICSIPENIGVEKVITHQAYNTRTKHNDIALVRLNRDIGFDTYFVKPVCLPFMKEYGLVEPKTLNSLTSVVAGWGRTNWTRSEGSSILQHVRLPIVSTEKCVKDFRNRVNITPEQLCAGGERNQDSCGGDSGGPLMIDTVIGKRPIESGGQFLIRKKFEYGIVSFGPVKCGIGIPGVYTRVTEYLSWILRNIEA